MKAMELGREKGYKIGFIRPITLFPFPRKVYYDIAPKIKAILDVEMNAGQMAEDVKLSVEGRVPVRFYGRMGGMIASPEEILDYFENSIEGGRK